MVNLLHQLVTDLQRVELLAELLIPYTHELVRERVKHKVAL